MTRPTSNTFLVVLSWWRDARGLHQAPTHPGDLVERQGWLYYGTTREPGPYLEAEGVLVSGVQDRAAHEQRGYRFRDLTPEELATMPDRVRMASVGPGDLVTFASHLPADAWQEEQIARWQREHGEGPYRVRHTSRFHEGMPMVDLHGWENGIIASWFRIVRKAKAK